MKPMKPKPDLKLFFNQCAAIKSLRYLKVVDGVVVRCSSFPFDDHTHIADKADHATVLAKNFVFDQPTSDRLSRAAAEAKGKA